MNIFMDLSELDRWILILERMYLDQDELMDAMEISASGDDLIQNAREYLDCGDMSSALAKLKKRRAAMEEIGNHN